MLYLLATHDGAREYENPHKSKEVTAAMSSAVTDYGFDSAPWRLVEHGHPGGKAFSDWNFTEDEPHQWLSIDLGPGRSLRVTHYALRHGNDYGYQLRSWRLEGSHDGSQWAPLKTHEGDESMPAGQGWCVGDWAVDGAEGEGYRHFRVIQTGENSFGNNMLFCAGIELYGWLRGAEW